MINFFSHQNEYESLHKKGKGCQKNRKSFLLPTENSWFCGQFAPQKIGRWYRDSQRYFTISFNSIIDLKKGRNPCLVAQKWPWYHVPNFLYLQSKHGSELIQSKIQSIIWILWLCLAFLFLLIPPLLFLKFFLYGCYLNLQYRLPTNSY